jgi:Calcineurin-like phosphoesterase
VQGSVFVDQNGNGRRDVGERGLANVSISNQDAVVATDAAGEFQIGRGPHNIVFVSVPDHYRIVGRFWRSVSDSPPRVEFALVEARSPEEFTFVHASDTHISPASANRTQRLRTMVDSLRPAFVLVAGDLVRDALRVPEAEATSYYNLFMEEMGRFATPMWTVPGNHEIFGIEQKLSHVEATHPLFGRKMYHHYLGPDYYSFTHGGVHFVGLNTVDVDGQSYYGHVDSVQLAWLARDLARIPPTMPVVTFDHIPMVSTMEPLGGYTDAPPAPTLITVHGKTIFRHVVSNAAEVLAVLRVRPHTLALGAHVHAGEKITYEIGGVKTRFEQSATVIGPSRVGPLTFPSGFTLYTVRKGVVDAGQFVPLVMPATGGRPLEQ